MKLAIDEVESGIRNTYMIDKKLANRLRFAQAADGSDGATEGLVSDQDIGIAVIEQEIEGLQAMMECMDDTFQAVIDAIYNLKGKVVVSGIGKSGYVAQKFATTLASTGTPSFFLHPAEAAHGDLGMLDIGDMLVLLSNSGNTTELYPIIEHAKRLEVTIIGIARNRDSKLIDLSDIKVILPAIPEASELNAPTTSAIMMMAYGDAVAVTLQRKRGFTADDYRLLHPAGAIGHRLKMVEEVMHLGEQMPLVHYKAILAEALIEMTKKRLGCVGVVDDAGNLVGVFTDGDLRRNVDKDMQTTLIGDVMTKNPKTFQTKQLATAVLHALTSKAITNAFVLENGKPIGVVHIHDLLK